MDYKFEIQKMSTISRISIYLADSSSVIYNQSSLISIPINKTKKNLLMYPKARRCAYCTKSRQKTVTDFLDLMVRQPLLQRMIHGRIWT